MKRRAFALLMILFVFPAVAEDLSEAERTAIQSHLADLSLRISDAKSEERVHGETVVGMLAKARAETLALTAAILEARLAASEAGLASDIRMPLVSPNPILAAEIETEMAKQEEIIAEAEREVETTGGLIQAVALSRVQAEKLTLSRLRGALMQARFGAMLPFEFDPDSVRTISPGQAGDVVQDDPLGDAKPAQLPWADPSYPEIDYSAAVFSQLDTEGFKIHGWWGLKETRAAIDDSAQVSAINLQEAAKARGFSRITPMLHLSCREGEPSVVFDADTFILSDFGKNTVPITWRIDDTTATRDQWSKLTSSKGAGVFGARGIQMMRRLYVAEKIFFRNLEERNGKTHDASFEMKGVVPVIDAIIAACGISLLELGRDDYRAIQEMLNAGGFNAGTPDGVWGNGSKGALRAYQEANGLNPTGALDQSTLRKMGLSF